MSPGIHLYHKPPGPTSFSLVQACAETLELRRSGRKPRLCHGGTLDPFAAGLLLILIEPATRLFDYLHSIPKVYQATVRWGIETDNGDPHGQVTATGDPSALRPEQLDEALRTFVGWHEQTPHATSARRVEGERAYVRAQRGETVVMPPARVYLHEATWLGHDLPHQSQLRIVTRGGYYVRALARDLGRLLGCGAHLTHLHRESIGPWEDPGPGHKVTVTGRDLLPWAPSRMLSNADIEALRQGQPIPAGGVVAPEWSPPEGFPDPEAPVRGFQGERFCFLLSRQDEQLRPLSILPGGL